MQSARDYGENLKIEASASSNPSRNIIGFSVEMFPNEGGREGRWASTLIGEGGLFQGLLS